VGFCKLVLGARQAAEGTADHTVRRTRITPLTAAVRWFPFGVPQD
jgi:hypothetical protein